MASTASSVYSAHSYTVSVGNTAGTGSTFTGYEKRRDSLQTLSTAARLHKYIRRIFRSDQVIRAFQWVKTETLSDGFRIRPLASSLSYCQPTSSLPKLSLSKTDKESICSRWSSVSGSRWESTFVAFVNFILVSIFLSFTSVCFGLVMGLGPRDIFELILWVTFVDFIFCGMIVASSMWFLCNKVST